MDIHPQIFMFHGYQLYNVLAWICLDINVDNHTCMEN